MHPIVLTEMVEWEVEIAQRSELNKENLPVSSAINRAAGLWPETKKRLGEGQR